MLFSRTIGAAITDRSERTDWLRNSTFLISPPAGHEPTSPHIIPGYVQLVGAELYGAPSSSHFERPPNPR